MFFRSKSFAIDLGNNNTLLTDKENILLSQPSYIVFDKYNNAVKAVGSSAYDIYEKSHDDLRAVKPLRWGVISDYESATKMIRELVSTIYTRKTRFGGFDNIISGVPFSTTEVERRALRDALDQFNSRKRHLLFEPLAAAMGMGLDIRQPDGRMVIDIGGGITEIVVISLSGVAVFDSTKVAGDSFNEDIQDYFRRARGINIGLKTAERVKIQVGSALEKISDPPEPYLVHGKDILEGIPVVRKTDHTEIACVLDKSIRSIEEDILHTLEACPPELAADIWTNGVYVTGGGALLRGLKERLEASIQLKVHIDPQPLVSVSKGISKALANPEKFKNLFI
ncbi:MAG TPA: rod shape-determining protein [Cyclobacteriaceae bacterium]|nr:rod shape-determining protein [Cyclobacteriaceae bacterium]